MLRAIAVRESTWYQYLTYPSGRPVTDWGSGDMISTPTADTTTFCNALATYGYQKDYGTGICPKTFSIVGVMSWEAPSWGQMPDNQNGAFPFNRNSTAFAVDYLAAHVRGCYEGGSTGLAVRGRVPTPPVISGAASAAGTRATGTAQPPTATSRASRTSSRTTRGCSPTGEASGRAVAPRTDAPARIRCDEPPGSAGSN